MVSDKKDKLSESISNNIDEELTEQQVFDVYEFAKSAYNRFPNVFTPDLVNQRMKDINMNPRGGTAEAITSALEKPQQNEELLIGYSEFFEYTDMIYKKVLSYIALLPSYDVTYVPTNATVSDLSKNQYKADEKRVVDFLYKLNLKEEFTKIGKQMIRQESYYSVFRDDGEKFEFQELPRNYCKITGRAEWGLLFDFDMNWFIQPAVDIDMYPSIFKKYYGRVFGNGTNNINKYIPSNAIDKRTGTYVYYVQTSMEDNFWAFKFNDSQVGNVPYFSPMFNDLVLVPKVRELQTNKYVIEATKMLIGLIPLLKDNKSGNVKDMMGIAPETLGKFLGLLRGSINDVYGLGAVPFEDIKEIDFKQDPWNMQVDQNKNTRASSGLTSNLIYNYEKMNMIETQNSIAVDEMIATQIYPQFEKFLEYYVNEKITTKYKFKFTLEGSNLPANKKERLATQMTLVDKGIVMHQKIASALGMLPNTLEMQMAMTKSRDWVENLTPVRTSYTLGSEDITTSDNKNTKTSGRTVKDDSELTDSGATTRSSGDNIAKGGNI